MRSASDLSAGMSGTSSAVSRVVAEPKLWHVVVTRFSYRHTGIDASSLGVWIQKTNLLDIRRLDFRLTVFSISCAPSLLGQTNQNFDWVIIIDRRLPQKHLDGLMSVVGGRPRTHLYVYDPRDDLTSTDWLRPYAPGAFDYLVTTQLDDDDALPINFIDAIQSRVAAMGADLPPIATLASRRALEWDLILSRSAPLGYRCSWHRASWVPTAGVSLLCTSPEIKLTVLSVQHQIADIWFLNTDGSVLRETLRVRWCLDDIRARQAAVRISEWIRNFTSIVDSALQRAGQCRKSWPSETLFFDLAEEVGPVIVTNHFLNDQLYRLFEEKSERVAVTHLGAFRNFRLCPERLSQNRRLFRKNLRVYIRLLIHAWTRQRRLALQLKAALWISWRFVSV